MSVAASYWPTIAAANPPDWHPSSFSEWIANWPTTSGFAGIAAVVAALIALWSASQSRNQERRQLDATLEVERDRLTQTMLLEREKLDANLNREREAASEAEVRKCWWEMYRWLIDHLFPDMGEPSELHTSAIIDIAEALLQLATEDHQDKLMEAVANHIFEIPDDDPEELNDGAVPSSVESGGR